MSQNLKVEQTTNEHSGSPKTAKHISTSYSKREDRLHFGFTMADDTVLSAWITRRTANSLVGALVREVERDPELLGVTALDGSVAAKYAATSAVKSFTQYAARIAKQQITPKTPPSRPNYTPGGLCTHIQLTQNRIGCVLVFSLSVAGTRSCKTKLNFTKIRNFIDALHTLFMSAGWPTDEFPAWVTTASQPAGSLSLN